MLRRYPAIVRTPVIESDSKIGKVNLIRLVEMRKAERKRIDSKRAYSRYKNELFIELFKDATGYKDLNKWELGRLKQLRKDVEEIFNIPINYFSVFVYKLAYDFIGWNKHNRKNAIGFFSNPERVRDFSYWLSEQNYSWRKRRSRYPDDFGKKWGRKLNIICQKLGIGNDCVFEEEVL